MRTRTRVIAILTAFVAICGLAIAADNFRINTSGGTSTTIDAAESGGVYTIRTTSGGPSSSAAQGIAPVVTATAASSKILKASAGNLYGYSGTSGASAGYFLVYDLAAAPSNGTVTPADCVSVPATTTIGVSYNPPLVMATGAVVAFSTTGCFTQTLSATAFISGEAK